MADAELWLESKDGQGFAGLFNTAGVIGVNGFSVLSIPGLGSGSESFGDGAFVDVADHATVCGAFAEASQDDCTVVGYQSIADLGVKATAIGANAQARASESVAVGQAAHANNADSVAVGRGANAVFHDGVAVGHGAVTSVGATAVGSNAQANSTNNVAIGLNSLGAAAQCVAVGAGAIADAGECTAIGDTARARNGGDTVVGANSTAQGGASGRTILGRATTLGAGTTNSVAVGAAQTWGAGGENVAIGTLASVGAAANQGVAVGVASALAAGADAGVAVGRGANVTGAAGTAIGWNSAADIHGLALGAGSAAGTAEMTVGSEAVPLLAGFLGRGKKATTIVGDQFFEMTGSQGDGAGVRGLGVRLSGGVGGDAATPGGRTIIAQAKIGSGTTLTDLIATETDGSVTFGVGGVGGGLDSIAMNAPFYIAALPGDPGAVPGFVAFYAKVSGGIAKLFAQNDDGTVVPLS